MRPPKISEPPDDLRAQFRELYGCGHDLEGITLAQILVSLGGLARDVAGPEAADAAFATLTRELGYTVSTDADWPAALIEDSFGDAFCWPMGVRLHDLNAYAYWGIALNGGKDAAEREALLVRTIDEVASFMAKIPFKAWGIAPGDAGRTLTLAQARFALDTGRAIDAATLAFLGGVTERRIRNMMAGKERSFTPDADGRIPAEEALSWLHGRPKLFRPSVWRQQNTFEDLAARPAEVEDAVFVPVAADNSVFHPGLARNGRFNIGRGRSEMLCDTFDDAVAALQKMTDPVWQRPTPRGLWTTVSAARWARFERVDLERIAETTRSTEVEGA